MLLLRTALGLLLLLHGFLLLAFGLVLLTTLVSHGVLLFTFRLGFRSNSVPHQPIQTSSLSKLNRTVRNGKNLGPAWPARNGRSVRAVIGIERTLAVVVLSEASNFVVRDTLVEWPLLCDSVAGGALQCLNS